MSTKKTLAFLLLILIPISHYFITPFILKTSKFKQNLVQRVSYTYETADNTKIKLYRQSSKGNIVNLDNERFRSARRFIRGISLLDSPAINNIKFLKIQIGDKSFSFNTDDIKKDWVKKNLQGKKYYFAPAEVSSGSNIKSFFSFSTALGTVVNWSPSILLNLLYFLVFILVLVSFVKFHKNLLITPITFEHDQESVSRNWLILLSSILLILTYITYYISKMEIDSHHSGFVFLAAQKLNEGKQLFKEVFFHYGAFTALIHAWSLKIFGSKLISLNITTSLFYTGIMATFFLLMRNFFTLKKSISLTICWYLFAPFFKDTFHPWSSIYCLFFLLVSLLFVFKYLENVKWKYLCFAGMSASLCFWSRQSVGPLVMLGLFLSLNFICLVEEKIDLKKALKTTLTLVMGFITVSLPFLIWIHFTESTEHWIIQNFKAQGEWAFGGPIHSSKVWKKILAILFPFNFWSLPPIASLFLVLKICLPSLRSKKFKLPEKKLLVLTVVALGSWAQYFPVPCNRHYFWAGTPMFIPFFFYIEVLLKDLFKDTERPSLKLITPLIFLSLYFGSFISESFDRVASGFKKFSLYRFEIKEPVVLEGMLVKSSESVQHLNSINKMLTDLRKQHPKISIVGEELYNQVFATFLPSSKIPGVLPSPAFTYGPLESKYQYFQTQSNFIREKRPIVYSGKPLKLEGHLQDFVEYKKYKFKKPFEYQSGTVYFYLHNSLVE